MKSFTKRGKEKGILTKKEARYLTAKTPVIYYVLKIHKNQENPLGRPIINGIDSLFSRLEYLDRYLQPLVSEGKSYLKDSRQLISELRSFKGEEEDILVTIDVNSLHTNIIQEDGVSSVEWALQS